MNINLTRTVRSAVAAAALAAGASLFAQSAPDISYDANADALQLPQGTYLGEVAGVATNSRGQVFVYTRTGHAVATLGDERTFYHGGSRLLQFDQNGRVAQKMSQSAFRGKFPPQGAGGPPENPRGVGFSSEPSGQFVAR